jgi:hypothetical protein
MGNRGYTLDSIANSDTLILHMGVTEKPNSIFVKYVIGRSLSITSQGAREALQVQSVFTGEGQYP